MYSPFSIASISELGSLKLAYQYDRAWMKLALENNDWENFFIAHMLATNTYDEASLRMGMIDGKDWGQLTKKGFQNE